MSDKNAMKKFEHRGRLEQIPMYLKKLFRMFVFMSDWKVLPMSALVAAITAMVVVDRMFVHMEGTITGSLALACICIWNGFFNSIQSICRERDVIKREHRNGMHITAYVIAHMIYQAFICVAQTVITLIVCKLWGMHFPQTTFTYYAYIGITLFLVTYAADMMALMISGIARTTTSAMTIMPFMLIFELVFSDSVFKLSSSMSWLTDLSLAKWGIRCLASQANYNSLPMVSAWNQLNQWGDVEVVPGVNLLDILNSSVTKDEFCMMMSAKNQSEQYATTMQNIGTCWMALIVYSIIFALITVFALKRIDSDKR